MGRSASRLASEVVVTHLLPLPIPRTKVRRRVPGHTVAGAILTAMLAILAPFAAADALPRLELSPAEVTASEDLTWTFELKLVNTGSSGIYADSLECLLADTGPGAKAGAPSRTFSIPALASAIGSVSAGDSTLFQQAYPASCENGTLSFRLYAHRSDGERFTLESATIRLVPGPVSTSHPSELLDVAGKKVEVVVFPSLKEGPAPGVLFVSDEGSHARQMLTTGLLLARRGYTVAFVSMPGEGRSESVGGDAAASQLAAAGAALDRLKKATGVDAARLAAWGVSRGARTVEALAGRRTDLAAVVAQSGRYDGAAPRKGHAPTLVLHGDPDPVAPADQARAFAARLEKVGVTVEAKFLTGAGHVVSRPDAQRAALAFLDARLMR